MTIEAGKKNCPVCLKNGTGYRPDRDDINGKQHVMPCRWPWDEAIGVLAEDYDEESSFAKVQRTGDFVLNASLSDPESSDIFYDGPLNYMEQHIGERVYYDYDNSIYVIECATNIAVPVPGGENAVIGKWPGAATIGYIKDVVGTQFTIHIDPRPARSTYIVANTPYIGTLYDVGKPVVINHLTNTISAGTTIQCDGVTAGNYIPTGVGLMRQVIVCVKGPAWISPSKNGLFAYKDIDELKAEYKFPRHIAIDSRLAFMPIISTSTDYYPYIGYVDLRSWDEVTNLHEAYVCLLVDIRPSNPSHIETTPLLEEAT